MEAIIFIGIQGSGKTSFYRQRFFDTHVRLNLDMLKTRHRQTLLLEACIAARQRFVLDNTSVLRSERADYILRAKQGGFQVHAYFFEPDAERAIAWNGRRSRKSTVPVKGVLGTLKRMERPQADEGFDRLYRVHIAESEFLVEEWQLQQ